MPNVLTTNSTVSCGHPTGGGGPVQVQSDVKLRVGTASVLLAAGIDEKPVNTTLCGIPVPPAANKKCTKVSSVSAGLATKLFVGGNPVVLQSLGGGTDGTIGGTAQLALAGVANQEKLRSA